MIMCFLTFFLFSFFHRIDNRVVYAAGCLTVSCPNSSLFPQAISAAKEADFVILVVGLDQTQEREGFDRTSIALPGYQNDLIEKVGFQRLTIVINIYYVWYSNSDVQNLQLLLLCIITSKHDYRMMAIMAVQHN